MAISLDDQILELNKGNTAKVTLGEREIMYSVAQTIVNPSFRGILRVTDASHSRWAGVRRVSFALLRIKHSPQMRFAAPSPDGTSLVITHKSVIASEAKQSLTSVIEIASSQKTLLAMTGLSCG